MNSNIESIDRIAEELVNLEKNLRAKSLDPREIPLFEKLGKIAINLSEVYNEFCYLELEN